ncbi:MAG: hypothetical protein CVU39_19535 [Chloroflexi bacterium HGW-Chloroflexi-10]|nr:MAG: hypothetical protein CVU39_19535 [Chloroflexi bacterium HGW-Chloroflexi-10]
MHWVKSSLAYFLWLKSVNAGEFSETLYPANCRVSWMKTGTASNSGKISTQCFPFKSANSENIKNRPFQGG